MVSKAARAIDCSRGQHAEGTGNQPASPTTVKLVRGGKQESDTHVTGQRLRVAAYARVSTGLASQSSSYENQVEIYTRKIQENPDWEFAGVYADPEISGTTDNRPEFQRMIRDAEKHKFDMVLVKSLSRFARNTLVSIQVIRKMSANGVRMVFEKENIDTSDPGSEMLLTIMSAFAQDESRNISERVKKGLRMRALNGKVCWTHLFGYRKVGDTTYVIDNDEAAVIRRVFDEYEQGATIREIADKLNADGIPSMGGAKWSAIKVSRLTDNERYAGDVVTNKQYTVNHIEHKQARNRGEVDQVYLENHHTAIIDKKQFERVQQIKAMKVANAYPFQGLLRCPHCRGILQYEPRALNTRDGAWKCDEDRFYIPADCLERLVLEAYDKLDITGVEDERTLAIKNAHPSFDRGDFWWMDDLMDCITFGEHTDADDHTMTVHWFCGRRTTLETGIPSMNQLRYKKMLWEEKQKAKAMPNITGELKVSKIQSADASGV